MRDVAQLILRGEPLRVESSNDDRPLLLLDGMSLAFRAFFALSDEIATSQGVVTNALHGFASMLATLVKTHRPRALAVAFDLPGGTFRDEMADDYKGGRAETPKAIEHQFDLIRDFCRVLQIPVVEVPGFEADDVLATLATWVATSRSRRLSSRAIAILSSSSRIPGFAFSTTVGG
jgi:DNA polymerase-1